MCVLYFGSMFLGCRQQQQTWLPVWKQPCCCLPAGATLASCIPVGIRIIQGDLSFVWSQQMSPSSTQWISHQVKFPYITIWNISYFVDFTRTQRDLMQLLHPSILQQLWRRRGKGLCIKPRSLNNGSLAWTARGEAICHGESGVPLSAIVECAGRLMRAGWFL